MRFVAFHFHGHAVRRMNLHRVAVTHVEDDTVSRYLNPVADTHQFQRLGVAVGHPNYRVGDEAAGQAVQGVVELALAQPLDHYLAALNLDHHVGMIALGEGFRGGR